MWKPAWPFFQRRLMFIILDGKQTYTLLRRETLSFKTVHYLIHPWKDSLDKSPQCLHLAKHAEMLETHGELPRSRPLSSRNGSHRVRELTFMYIACWLILKLRLREMLLPSTTTYPELKFGSLHSQQILNSSCSACWGV